MKRYLILAIMLFLSGCQTKKNHLLKGSFEQDKDALILQFKETQNVKGLAFAIFDSTHIIWQNCLGRTTYGSAVNDKTLFSIQSISKNVTALAVMIAVQEGLLDLDAPISRYMPEFRINSRFGEHPERTITLRMLLSHTAGFVHEAPVGNNYDYSPCTFEDHLKSIRNTSLMSAPGSTYSYSNCGVDVAAEIVERASGMKFSDYLRLKMFEPLGMTQTTIEDERFVANANKTEGTIRFHFAKHYRIPLMGSGAVYTNLSDFVKYVQLQMNWGNLSNKRLIDKKYLCEMYAIKLENYGLGTYIGKSNEGYYINHNGMGYGYSATMLWYPEYGLGCILLCNKQCKTFDICEAVMRSYIQDKKGVRDQSVTKDLDFLNSLYFSRLHR